MPLIGKVASHLCIGGDTSSDIRPPSERQLLKQLQLSYCPGRSSSIASFSLKSTQYYNSILHFEGKKPIPNVIASRLSLFGFFTDDVTIVASPGQYLLLVRQCYVKLHLNLDELWSSFPV